MLALSQTCSKQVGARAERLFEARPGSRFGLNAGVQSGVDLARHSLSTLRVALTRAYSEPTCSTPLSRNFPKPCACLIYPKTGSTMVLHHA